MRVPTEFVPQTLPEGREIPQAIQANPADFGAQAGQTLQQAGNQDFQLAIQKQQLQNETQVNDTFNNKFFPQFENMYNKYYSLMGKDAVDGRQQAQQDMRNFASQTRDSLDDPLQQRMFDQMANRRMQIEFAGMDRYADQQNKVWQQQTSAATIQTYESTAMTHANDPIVFENSLHAIQNEQERIGKVTGWSAETLRAQKQKAVNNLYQSVIMRQAQTDPTAAMGLYNVGVRMGDIDGPGQYDITARLKPLYEAQQVSKIADRVTQNPAWMGGQYKQQLWDATTRAGGDPRWSSALVAAEGGKVDAESPTGAYGLGQFTKGTWKDVMGDADIKDPNNQITAITKYESVVQNSMAQGLGRQATPQEKYVGWVAGPAGAVKLLQNPTANAEQILGKDGKTIVESNGGNAGMTAQQFVQLHENRFLKSYNGISPTGVPTLSAVRDNFPAMEKEVKDAIAAKLGPDSDAAQQMGIRRLASNVNMQAAADKMQIDNAQNVLRQAVVNGATSVQQATSTPEGAQAWGYLADHDPGALEYLDAAYAHNAGQSAKVLPTKENQTLYAQLLGQGTNPDTQFDFANSDLTQYYGKLPQQQWQQLLTMQKGINTKTLEAQAQGTDYARLISSKDFNSALLAAGYQFNKPKNSARQNELNIFYGELRQRIQNWYENNPKARPTHEDLMEMTNHLLTQGIVKGTANWAGFYKTYRLADAMAAGAEDRFVVGASEIPANDKAQMNNMWNAYFHEQPTDKQLSMWATAEAREDQIPAATRQNIIDICKRKWGRPPTSRETALFYTQLLLKSNTSGEQNPAAQTLMPNAPKTEVPTTELPPAAGRFRGGQPTPQEMLQFYTQHLKESQGQKNPD